MTAPGEQRARFRLAALLCILTCAAVLLLWRSGEISPTYDELVDASIVECYVETRDLFACDFDITQARFPFYVHAAARLWFPWADGRTVDLGVSAAAALALIVATWALARRLLGERAALIAAALLAFSPAFLAMGRMTVTHANVIFTLATLSSVIAGDAWVRTRSRPMLLTSAALFGLSVGTNLLGSLTAVLFIILLAPDAKKRLDLRDVSLFALVALGAFIASSPIYLMLANGRETLKAIVEIEDSTASYNYLALGVNKAPRWYSLLLFAVKFTPWWTALAVIGAARTMHRREDATRRTLLAGSGFILFYLVVKSVLFRYDAPHHQAHLLPLACILAAYGAETGLAYAGNAIRRLTVAALAVGFAAQLAGIAAFFPNYLFYGAQYGERFVGEFYGPAAIHCQGLDAVNDAALRLLDAGEDVRVTTRLCWKFPYRDAPMASYDLPDDGPAREATFVVSPWNDGRFDASTYGVGLGGLRRALEKECDVVVAARFPYLSDAYTLFRCPQSVPLQRLPRLTREPVPSPWR